MKALRRLAGYVVIAVVVMSPRALPAWGPDMFGTFINAAVNSGSSPRDRGRREDPPQAAQPPAPEAAAHAVPAVSVPAASDTAVPAPGAAAPPPVASPAAAPDVVDELAVDIPSTRISDPGAVAVIMGVRDYAGGDVPSVEYALNDAEMVRRYLVQSLGFREGNIIMLANPTKGRIETVFGTRENARGQLMNYADASGSSDIFIYYCGHGAPDLETKKAYLVPADCHPDYVAQGGYEMDLLYANIAKVPARSVTVVIDACFSGSSQAGMLIAKASPIAIEPVLGGIPAGINVLSSSAGDEISSWYPEKKHSLFTYYFLRGLRGEADADRNGRITFAEMKAFVDQQVPYTARRLYNRSQRPQFTGDAARVLPGS